MGGHIDRRTFLRTVAAGGVTAGILGGSAWLARDRRPDRVAEMDEITDLKDRKLIIIQFGGGTRCAETIDDAEHRWIPKLWKEMVPRGSLFTNMRVHGKVVHPNSTGSMMTGHWEWDHLDWSRPLEHPSLFEINRKDRAAPDTDAWAFVYASILNKAGVSTTDGYGEAFAANIVEPPTIPRKIGDRMSTIIQRAAMRGSLEDELRASRECAQLARKHGGFSHEGLRSAASLEFVKEEERRWKSEKGTTSHDAFLTDRAISCMETFAPMTMLVAFGEIDCAHYGSWSRYVEAIQRTDELTHRIWEASNRLPAYKGKTLVLILPDHGRELDRSGGHGFVHHSDFYTNKGADEGCRRVWMLALGPSVERGKRIADPVAITSTASTGLEWLGLSASPGAAASVLPMVRMRPS